MKIKEGKCLPPKGFRGINIFGTLYVREGYEPSERMVNHELIHTVQMKEMLWVFFYLWYGIEWSIKFLFKYWNRHTAYRNISFEREAYENEKDFSFLESRNFWNFLKYI